MKPQIYLDKLPAPKAVPMPAASDGVGRALRSSYAVQQDMPVEFAMLIARIDVASTRGRPG